MQRDEHGIPIIGARDTRPIKLRVMHKDGGVIVVDQATSRPLTDIAEIVYTCGPAGVELALVFKPESYELMIEERGKAIRLPAQIVDKNGDMAELKEGEQIMVLDKGGNPRAVLSVALFPKQ